MVKVKFLEKIIECFLLHCIVLEGMILKKYINRNDFILIGILVIGFIMIAVSLILVGKKGNSVLITVDGHEQITLPLDIDTTYEIQGYDGGKNYLVIEDGQAYLEDATCPDHLCVNMGKISEVGQSIICLPNRVVVEVVGDSAAPEYDTLAE